MFQSHGHSAAPRPPGDPGKERGQALPRPGEPTHPASQSPEGTFCLLSSRCTCSTKRLSLRLLTEMPEGEDRGRGSRVKAGSSLGSPGLWLTCQVGVINPLLDFGVLHDDHSTGCQEQLPGSGFVALSVVFHHGHCILRTEGGARARGGLRGLQAKPPHPLPGP